MDKDAELSRMGIYPNKTRMSPNKYYCTKLDCDIKITDSMTLEDVFVG